MLLGKVVDNQIIFYVMAAIAGIGILAKIIARMITGKLLREAANMHHSNHILIKLIKAKYEHANLVTERVQNVEAFVDKYLYEYRIMGIKCYNWQSIEMKCMWTVLAIGVIGGALQYLQSGFGEKTFQLLVWGAVGGMCLFLLHTFTDERRRMTAIRTYIVDYLQNVCAHRYAKMEPPAEEVIAPVDVEKVKTVMEAEEKEDKPASEILIREILEEFLA